MEGRNPAARRRRRGRGRASTSPHCPGMLSQVPPKIDATVVTRVVEQKEGREVPNF